MVTHDGRSSLWRWQSVSAVVQVVNQHAAGHDARFQRVGRDMIIMGQNNDEAIFHFVASARRAQMPLAKHHVGGQFSMPMHASDDRMMPPHAHAGKPAQ